jgi:hypothetical protein
MIHATYYYIGKYLEKVIAMQQQRFLKQLLKYQREREKCIHAPKWERHEN